MWTVIILIYLPHHLFVVFPFGLSVVLGHPFRNVSQIAIIYIPILITSIILLNPVFFIYQCFLALVIAYVQSVLLPWSIGFYGGESGSAAVLYHFYYLLVLLCLSIVTAIIGLACIPSVEEPKTNHKGRANKERVVHSIWLVGGVVIIAFSLWLIGLGAGLTGTNFNFPRVPTGWDLLQGLLAVGGGVSGSIGLSIAPVAAFYFMKHRGRPIREKITSKEFKVWRKFRELLLSYLWVLSRP